VQATLPTSTDSAETIHRATVLPDHYLLTKDDSDVIGHILGGQNFAYFYKENGPITWGAFGESFATVGELRRIAADHPVEDAAAEPGDETVGIELFGNMLDTIAFLRSPTSSSRAGSSRGRNCSRATTSTTNAASKRTATLCCCSPRSLNSASPSGCRPSAPSATGSQNRGRRRARRPRRRSRRRPRSASGDFRLPRPITTSAVHAGSLGRILRLWSGPSRV